MSRCQDGRREPFGALSQVQVENDTEPWYNVNRIAAEYDVSDNDVQADLLSFIHEMKTIAAVEAVPR
jgi:hypothetical protein